MQRAMTRVAQRRLRNPTANARRKIIVPGGAKARKPASSRAATRFGLFIVAARRTREAPTWAAILA
jgi:hypothetical protein